MILSNGEWLTECRSVTSTIIHQPSEIIDQKRFPIIGGLH
jgi:hypothetical protein